MKKILLCMGILITGLCSCNEKKSYELVILLCNKTNGSLSVQLYPKKEYMSGTYYSTSSNGSGHSETFFEVLPDREAHLYTTTDLNLHPEVLAATVFDSIHIETNTGVKKELKFAHGSVAGYAENLFEDMSYWKFIIRELDVSSSVTKTCESHDYIFSVSNDKFR